MSIIINPGSGPVPNATREQAEVSIKKFIEDLGLEGVTYEYVKPCLSLKAVGEWPDVSFVDGEPDGRFEYTLTLGDRTCPVEMPGLPIDRVRYLGKPQNIWDYPRLYVDGSSWVWCYAISSATRTLTGEDDDE